MTASLPQVVIDQVLLGQTRVVLGTVQNPLGEIDGEIPVNLDLSVNFELSPQQLSPPAISNASGTGYALVGIDGATAFSGLLTNLQGTLTSIEIHRGAWLGQQGTLLLLVNAIGNPNPSTISFNAFLPKPEADVHRDLHDGMCYVIVRTLESPQGELRGQIRNLRRGDRYCKGRPNSVSQAGASLEMYGSPLASDNDVQLQGRDLPPGKVVLPILGFGSGHVFTKGGVLCVGGAGVGRLSSYLTPATGQGEFQAQLDLSNFSIGGSPQSLQPGMRIHVQLWYRDPQGPTSSNFSSAISTVFH
jgi:hypothetical protein